MAEIIYSKFSNERDRKFAIRTDMMEDEGRRFVKKTAIYPEGKQHEENLMRWHDELSKMYEKAPFSCNLCEKGKEGVFFEYVEGQTLEERLDALLAEEKVAEAEEELVKYAECVKKLHSVQSFEVTKEFENVFGTVFGSEEKGSEIYRDWKCAPATNIDLVCANLILKNEEFFLEMLPKEETQEEGAVQEKSAVVVDYEWTFDFPIPAFYVVYRIVHYYEKTHAHREVLKAQAIYEKLGITEEYRKIFAEMEKHFQQYMRGKHVAVREMYATMTPGICGIREEGEGALQIYFSDGNGLSEEHSKRLRVNGQCAEHTVKIPSGCKELRIDPGDIACAVRVQQLAFGDKKVDLAQTVIAEGAVYGNWVYIAKADPNIAGIMVPEGAEELTVNLQIFPQQEDVLKNTVAQLNQMKAQVQTVERLKNTSIGKVCRKIRRLTKRKANE